MFRRGEPQLLASIKRKTTRPSNADGGSLASPTEEYDQNRAMAGWMRDTGGSSISGGGYRHSPPRDPKPMSGPPPHGRPKVFGYNAQTGEYGDLIALGIVDPVKVVRTALQNAASVASLLITTEAMIAELPKKDAPALPGGGMGGMGGMDF